MTVVLLSAAGLLMRSLANTATSDPGFEPSRVLAFDVSLPSATYHTDEKRMAFWTDLRARVAAVPGVEHAGEGMAIPFSGGGFGEYFFLPGQTGENDVKLGRLNYVSPGYLEALGTRLIAGRFLTEADNVAKGPRVAVINQTAARGLFGATSPLEQPVIVAAQTWQIVGVIADVADRQLDAARRAFAYVPQSFNPGNYSMVVRTRLDPASLVNSIRSEIARLDPGVALANPRALDDAMATSLTPRRTMLTLVGAFAVERADAGLHRAVRRDGLFGQHAPPRDLHPDGARRRTPRGDRSRPRGRRPSDGRRLVARRRRRAGGRAAADQRAVSGEQLRSAGDRRRRSPSVATVAILACWLPAWRAARFDPISALRND